MKKLSFPDTLGFDHWSYFKPCYGNIPSATKYYEILKHHIQNNLDKWPVSVEVLQGQYTGGAIYQILTSIRVRNFKKESVFVRRALTLILYQIKYFIRDKLVIKD